MSSVIEPFPKEIGLIELYSELLKKNGEISEADWDRCRFELSPESREALIKVLARGEDKEAKERDEKEKFEKMLQGFGVSAEKIDVEKCREEYRKLLPLTRLGYAFEKNGDPEEHALKLILAFGTKDKAVEYLKKYELTNPDVEDVIHEACLFTLPCGAWNIQIWQQLANKYMPNKEFQKIFGRGNEIEAYVEKEKKNLIEKARTDVLVKWEFVLGEEYEKSHPSVTEEEYVQAQLKKQDKKVEREAINQWDAQVRSDLGIFEKRRLSSEDAKRVKDYKNSPEGQEQFKKIKSEMQSKLSETFRKEYQEKVLGSNAEKQKYIEEHLKDEKIQKEIAQQINLIFSEQTPLETFQKYYKYVCYKRAEENLWASSVFLENEMSEKAFNAYLDLSIQDSNRIPPLIKRDNPIPILVDGNDIHEDYQNFYLTKLSPSDPRCAVLGKRSSCCQHLDHSLGGQCAKHGITSKEGGFYVLCQRKEGMPPSIDDPIVAQCWAWRSQSDKLVFDSIETPVHYRNNKDKQVMIADFFTYFGHKLVTEHDISRVLVGAGSNTPKSIGFLRPLDSEQPLDYSGYRDSYDQRIIADKRLPFVKGYTDKEKSSSKLSDIKELKEKEEDKKIREDIEFQKQAIFEWCNLCVTNYREADLSYIIPKAEALGISVSQLKKRFSQTERFLELLTTPGDFKEIIHLLKEGVSPLLKDVYGGTALTLAVEKGSAEQIQALLDAGASVSINAKTYQGSALYLAVQSKDAEKVSILLKAGASVNEGDNYGNTPLHEAIRNKDAAIVSVLLAAGASVSQKNGSGETPLFVAAILSKDTALVSALLARGASVNEKQKDGESVLSKAIQRGLVEIVSILLEAGAREGINEKNKDGWTPLIFACFHAKAEMVKLLLDNGASQSINVALRNGITPLILASKIGEPRIVELLLDAGAHDLPDKDGETALSIAEKTGNVPIVTLLKKALEKKQKAEAESSSGPLHFSYKAALTSPDIIKEAHELVLREASDPVMEKKIKEFMVKLGLSVSDTIVNISGESIRVLHGDHGAIENYNIKELYDRQVASSSSKGPKTSAPG